MTARSRTDNLDGLRQRLFDVLDHLQDETKPLDVERANATVEVARTIIATAKVQVDYLKATGQEGSQDAFLQPVAPAAARANPAEPGNGIASITRHVLKG